MPTNRSISFKWPPDLIDLLDRYARATGQQKSAIAAEALRRYLRTAAEQNAGLAKIIKQLSGWKLPGGEV